MNINEARYGNLEEVRRGLHYTEVNLEITTSALINAMVVIEDLRCRVEALEKKA